MISGMSGGDHYKTVFGDGLQMASDEAAHAGNLRDAADQEHRQMMAAGDFWQDGAFNEAIQAARGDFQKNLAHADIHDNMSGALNRSVETAQDALQRSISHLMR